MKNFIKSVIKYLKIQIYRPTEVDKYRKQGVTIGKNCNLYSVSIDGCFQHLIKIGNNVTITHSSIIAHDASTHNELGYSKVGRINIGNDVFIGWGCIILGNVTIGNKVIIGAGSVVAKNIPDNTVVCGNPLRFICTYDEYINKNRENMKTAYISNVLFSEKTTLDKEIQCQELLNEGGMIYNC